MKHLICSIVILSLVIGCKNKSKVEVKTKEQIELSNKQKAITLLKSLETGDKKPVSYINPNKYIQHNLTVSDGLEGFKALTENIPEDGFKVDVIRAFQDKEYVFTHTKYDFFGLEIGFDVFRFENGQIVEHWDNLIEVFPPNPSNHTQIDGTTKITDLELTESNKKLVANFVDLILVKRAYDKIGNYIEEENYIQHNPNIADGLSGLQEAIASLAKKDIQMVYTKTHKILGEGNFVLSISEGTFANKPTSFYDLFRIENNKIVEHWDTIEEIIPKKNRKNDNDKFNFSN